MLPANQLMSCLITPIGGEEMQALHESFGIDSVLRLKSLRKILVNELGDYIGKILIVGEP